MTRSAFDAPGRWLKGNLHTHTTTSDGGKPAGRWIYANRL